MTLKLDNSKLKIALQRRGRLATESLSLLKALGLDFESFQGRLFSHCQNFPLDILFLRDDDIPEYVQDAVADLGIVGQNVVVENRAQVHQLDPLGFGFCTLTIAVPGDHKVRSVRDLAGTRIATSHPNTLSDYLRKEQIEARVITISGSVEITPTLDVADSICDLVSTGSTLKVNGLIPLQSIFESQAVLVANRQSLECPQRGQLIAQLRSRLQSHLQARRTKYVMMNAPRTALPAIQDTLPGMKSPTVMDLAEEGMIAVHSAVPEGIFWEVIENLKKAGAQDILVLPVEKMVV
jgi:ATP phosphoribosyltransferase